MVDKNLTSYVGNYIKCKHVCIKQDREYLILNDIRRKDALGISEYWGKLEQLETQRGGEILGIKVHGVAGSHLNGNKR